MVATTFPSGHKRGGEPTGFIDAIRNKQKIHTIRGNAALWYIKITQVINGHAYLSIRSWSGKPYRSPQIEHFRVYNCGIQFAQAIKNAAGSKNWLTSGCEIEKNALAANDGLSVDDFDDWFKSNDEQSFAIIHFTKFRYKPHD